MARGVTSARTLRCAIYTRKSSEEGLDQTFNSLDAQREACTAFIASQKHEGWSALEEMYDDGGFSGGSMDRPALARLLADIDAGKINVVVVYKVDRLTRSLSDFARIIEVFDRRGVSFVSVTQQFNTTSSMGRLTLNVLLSFAQFEREVTGERIRDKIAASKRKGMWMGGLPPLGYDIEDRKLVVNEAEAQTVRRIFTSYVELGSVRLLKASLDAAGIVNKGRQRGDGTAYGGKPMERGPLYYMLQNRIYRGEIVHKDNVYPGDHAAIVDEDLWTRVQALLADNRTDRRNGVNAQQPSLLAGLLFDGDGGRLTPTHAVKKGARYRYYVSATLQEGTRERASSKRRIPATDIEALVKNRIRGFLADPAALLNAMDGHIADALAQQELLDRSRSLAGEWNTMPPGQLRALLRAIVLRIDVLADRVDITLDRGRLEARLAADGEDRLPLTGPSATSAPLLLSVPARLQRTGIEMRMIVDGPREASPDGSLLRVLARAHALKARLEANRDLTLEQISQSDRVGGSYLSRLLRLTFLAPDIVTTILSGRHPPELTAAKLMRDTRLPLDWQAQRQRLGFI